MGDSITNQLMLNMTKKTSRYSVLIMQYSITIHRKERIVIPSELAGLCDFITKQKRARTLTNHW